MEKSDSAPHIYAQREADTTGRLLRVILCAHLLRWKMAVNKTEIHFAEYFGPAQRIRARQRGAGVLARFRPYLDRRRIARGFRS
jgi:hypothetical protein